MSGVRKFRAPKPPPPDVYDVPEASDKAEWPQRWLCMNVMCREPFWREYGESEFCPSCRKCIGGRRG